MAGRVVRLKSGSVLFSPGEKCAGYVVVRSGQVKVSLFAENGREIVLYRVRPGEVCLQTFGCLINGNLFSAEGRAETDIEFELIPDNEFQHRVVEDATFRADLFAAVAARFVDMEQMIESVMLTGLKPRLARCLLRLSDHEGHVISTHENLAAETGSGRAAVTRCLGELAQQGVLEVERGLIRIIDIRALTSFTQGAM